MGHSFVTSLEEFEEDGFLEDDFAESAAKAPLTIPKQPAIVIIAIVAFFISYFRDNCHHEGTKNTKRREDGFLRALCVFVVK
jgi:hypothetical protein